MKSIQLSVFDVVKVLCDLHPHIDIIVHGIQKAVETSELALESHQNQQFHVDLSPIELGLAELIEHISLDDPTSG